ncbi:class I SAM-dependent methyltransferase [Sphingomicrobium nitratireducens]|uniref:class I SAM-dependent methyltransferase n=1 Tax=Sphingomicrobium nitratireducens TaxID=2964666 RepID=UPI00223F3471|nr:class I SAM-dependent methyltransferase [Sphingomicrobium nitratireducens]
MTDPYAVFEGELPAHYDEGLGPVLFEPFAQDLAQRIAGEEAAPAELLELAAGTGILTRALARALPATMILATDLNLPMLALANERVGRSKTVRFAEADAMAIGLKDGSVDALACQFGVMFFPDKVASYREAKRVLRPGRPYWFNSWCGHDANPFAAIAQDVCDKAYPGDAPSFYRHPFSYPEADRIADDLAQAGFADIRLKRVAIDSPVADWDAFSRGIVYGNPLHHEILERDGPSPEEMRLRIRDRLEEALGKAPTEMPLAAHVVRASA